MPAVDIYHRGPNQEGYLPGIIELNDDLANCIMQIEMILFTSDHEVLGYSDLSINLEDLVYTFRLNESEIKAAIHDRLRKYCSYYDQFQINVNVTFYEGEITDTAIIDIIIDGRNILGISVS